MRTMVRKFNSYNSFDATMTPMAYTKKRPLDKLPAPGKNTFKVIDLDGSDDNKNHVIVAIRELLKSDTIQILEDQPSVHELRFWISSNDHAALLKDTWAIPVGLNIARLGPVGFSGQDFLNRNRWVEKSDSASVYSSSRLLVNLEIIG